ncbi:hypothetical protein GBZ26_10005 [Azospirillum formosense]|uniref:Cellulose biosynthesis protein BcsE n=1 Tax=Azospirillum formosense TaxID=861533 RepID=A0ABX2KXG7_9PROT|nr:hypothetical protein [Azospirillum formosense]MBY3757671.1 hypothetical protein [Azospirillum formosense]NUB19544.1 hypothetical protein [Azospirillum formosense]
MDRSTYRLIASTVYSRRGFDTASLLQRLADAGQLGDCIVSVDTPASAVSHMLREERDAKVFMFPSHSWLKIVGRGQPTEIPVLLSDRDRDLEEIMDHCLVRITPQIVRLRTVDGLFSGSGLCTLLHVNDGQQTTAVLRGARRLLSSARPFLLISVSGLPVQERLQQLEHAAALLKDHDYRLVDATLLSADTPETREEAVLIGAQTGFLGIPRERVSERLIAHLAGFDGDLPTPPSGALSDDDVLIAALIRASATRLQRAPQNRSMHIVFDDRVVCEGFYSPECDGYNHWRWSGPFPEARVFLPLEQTGRMRLVLQVMNAIRSEIINSLRLYIDGKPVNHQTIEGSKGWTLSVSFETPLDHRKGWCELRLAYGNTVQPSNEDPRRLGLCISSCQIQGIDA